MKKLFNIDKTFLLLFLAVLACIFGNFNAGADVDTSKPSDNVKNLKSVDNADNLKLINTGKKYDCKTCPDVEPYIEEHNEFWGSNLQMIYWAQETLKSLYDRYEKLYNDILKTYAEDKDFIDALKADKKVFEAYRDTQKKLVYPRNENYGMMQHFSNWESDYTLTVIHIERLKRKISLYCFNNSALLKDENVCSEENINKKFDSLKLKEPKPIITTPYDKKVP